MDYMMLNRQGPDLLTVLNRVRTGLTIPHVKRIARCALSALEHCHARGIIHCDLKPENLMYPVGGYDPDRPSDVVLIDFGSVRYTGCTDRVGSLGYIAPEVILYQPKTTACDIWSLGVVLFSARMSIGLFLDFDRVEDYLDRKSVV